MSLLARSLRARPRLRRLPVSIRAYILRVVADRAKLFQNGGSQAVRLPKSCRFADGLQEVLVHRVGRKVILEPADEWPEQFVACLGGWDEAIERPAAQPIGKLRNPFA